MTHKQSAMNTPLRLLLFRFFCVFALVPGICLAGSFEHQYTGNTPPEEAVPPLVTSRKSGGGQVSTESGTLRVEVPAGANHFYTIEGGADFDGASEAGTTLDFSLMLQGADAGQAVFSIRVGTGEASWHVVFYPGQIQIGSRAVVHDSTRSDVYRISFQDGKMSLFSARSGELAAEVRPETKLGENRISFGTRSPITVVSPVRWELGFLRWTNKEAIFSPPSQSDGVE